MKINIEEAKEEFIKYTENFNTKDKNVKRKQQHSIRVMKIAKQIATQSSSRQLRGGAEAEGFKKTFWSVDINVLPKYIS